MKYLLSLILVFILYATPSTTTANDAADNKITPQTVNIDPEPPEGGTGWVLKEIIGEGMNDDGEHGVWSGAILFYYHDNVLSRVEKLDPVFFKNNQ